MRCSMILVLVNKVRMRGNVFKNLREGFRVGGYRGWKLSSSRELACKAVRLEVGRGLRSDTFPQHLLLEGRSGLSRSHGGPRRLKTGCTPYLALPTTRYCNLDHLHLRGFRLFPGGDVGLSG